MHREGLWHRTFHCWFVGGADGEPCLFLQKRSMEKADFPGLLDITAARHLLAGERDREGIGKIGLELGLDVDFEDVHYLGIRTYTEQIGPFYNREFNSVYLYDAPYALSDFSPPSPPRLPPCYAVPWRRACRLVSGEVAETDAVGLFVEDGARKTRKQRITLADFVPRNDDYYTKIFTLTLTLHEGKCTLAL